MGEARGVWLATVFWPSIASLLLIEHMLLVDLADLPKGPNDYPWLVFGAPSGRLTQRGVGPSRAQAAPAGASPAIDAGP